MPGSSYPVNHLRTKSDHSHSACAGNGSAPLLILKQEALRLHAPQRKNSNDPFDRPVRTLYYFEGFFLPLTIAPAWLRPTYQVPYGETVHLSSQ